MKNPKRLIRDLQLFAVEMIALASAIDDLFDALRQLEDTIDGIERLAAEAGV